MKYADGNEEFQSNDKPQAHSPAAFWRDPRKLPHVLLFLNICSIVPGISRGVAATARALNALISFLASRSKAVATAAAAAAAAGNVTGAATTAVPPRLETTVCLVARRLAADVLLGSIVEAAKVDIQLQFVIIGQQGECS